MTVTGNDTRTRDVQPWFTTALDVAQCDRFEIVIPLIGEYESAGIMFESWPAGVQALVRRELAALAARLNADKREVRAVSYGTVTRDNKTDCVVIVHHAGPDAKAGAIRRDQGGVPSVPSTDGDTSRVPSKPAPAASAVTRADIMTGQSERAAHKNSRAAAATTGGPQNQQSSPDPAGGFRLSHPPAGADCADCGGV